MQAADADNLSTPFYPPSLLAERLQWRCTRKGSQWFNTLLTSSRSDLFIYESQSALPLRFATWFFASPLSSLDIVMDSIFMATFQLYGTENLLFCFPVICCVTAPSAARCKSLHSFTCQSSSLPILPFQIWFHCFLSSKAGHTINVLTASCSSA